MKKWMLLQITVMMSCIGFSQDLKPILRQINDEPHFCFNKEQSKELAKLLTLGSYADSIVSRLKIENIRLRLLVRNKEQVMDFQLHQLRNYKLLLGNSEVRADLLGQKIKARDRTIKRSKTHKLFFGAGLIIITTLLIIK